MADGSRDSPSPEPSDVRRARVLLNEPVGLLDYRIPDALRDAIRPGVPVHVPLGKRTAGAYVAKIVDEPLADGITLRDIEKLDPGRPRLPESLIELILFAADYYAAEPGDVLAAALPAAGRQAAVRYRITDAGREAAALQQRDADQALLEVALRFEHGFTVAALERDLGWTRRSGSARLKRHVDRGWLERLSRRHGPRQALAYERVPGADPGTLTARQAGARALFDRIPDSGTVLAATLAAADKGVHSKLKTLEKAGLIRRRMEEQRCRPEMETPAPGLPPEPTAAQARAIERIGAAIEAQRYETFLVQGVTGSGKTEVYLRVIEQALARKKTALVLVPEIALTPQLGARFRERFGEQVATFHSALTVAERRDEWERVARKQALIGLGARSALFLPLENLGVVIVDEEHETSFKQEESPRYNARDLAVVRGHYENAVVVLGSATPSLESRANADGRRYTPIILPTRVHGRPMPVVDTINLARAERVGEGVFTAPLASAIDKTLSAGGQAILFLNRRGFAPYIYCKDCGHSFRCGDCDVSLTLHRRRDALVCHYCGFEEPAPDECPSCRSHKVISFGLGTERVENEIAALFGGVTTARLDRDTVRRRADLDRQLARFARGDARILIGTQMVAKGHDFPGVTLVGVIAADASLNFPDFRSAERTFQLLTQVAGRAGRGDELGRVLVQAYETEHYAIRSASTHDYEAFVRQEVQTRRELGYPPYSHLVLLRFESPSESAAHDEARNAAQRLRETARQVEGVVVLGPAPAPLARLRGAWRYQVLLKGDRRGPLRQVLGRAHRRPRREVRQILDVDPFNML